jgi:hypothetical protein
MRVAVCPLVSDHGPEMSHRWFRFFSYYSTVLLWVVFLWARSAACRCLDLGTPPGFHSARVGSLSACLLIATLPKMLFIIL